MELVGRFDGAGLLQQSQRRQVRGARGLDHGLVFGCVLVRAEQDLEKLLADRRRAAARGQLGRPVGNLLQDDLLLFDGGQRLLQDFSRRLLETPLARAAKVVRCLEQAKQGAGLLRQRGVGAEIVARQVGKAEFALGGELPGQLQLDGLRHGGGLGHEFGRSGLLELDQDVGGLDLDALAAVQLDLGRGFRLRQHTPGHELAGFFKQYIHGRDCPSKIPAARLERQSRFRKSKIASIWSSKSLRAWSPPGSSLIVAPG